MPTTNLLTTAEAARLLGISPRTLANWRRVGVGPTCKRLGYSIVRYREADVLRWVEQTNKKLGRV